MYIWLIVIAFILILIYWKVAKIFNLIKEAIDEDGVEEEVFIEHTEEIHMN